MLIETTTLPVALQQQILQFHYEQFAKNSQKKTLDTPNALEYFANVDYPAEVGDSELNLSEKTAKKPSLYDIFANADSAVADIDFELPPRTISNRPIPFEND